MTIGFVLITCESSHVNYVLAELKKIKQVYEICSVFGTFDFVIRIKAKNKQIITEIIHLQIRRIKKLKSTLTLLASDPDGEFL